MRTLLEKKFFADVIDMPIQIYGIVRKISAQSITVSGLSGRARIGDQVDMHGQAGVVVRGEIILICEQDVVVTAYHNVDGLNLGAKAVYLGPQEPRPCQSWIGKVLDHSGRCLGGSMPAQGDSVYNLGAIPPKNRKVVGSRLDTGLAAIDTFLPLCRGQRLGLFAGSGVGKSTLLADLAKGVEVDVVILALVGERGREVREFTEKTLGEVGMKKSIVFVATSEEPPALKLRAAFLAMATAEYFRDQGKHVLLLFDSLTRFAEAHRSVALSAGETPSLRAYPPSTFQALAQLCERAGPGHERMGREHMGGEHAGGGDITAVFSVLVAGSNMEEPVADMVRGILDGHIVLEREIAERGRYPAIDIRRSVSRSLPDCATNIENGFIAHARGLIGSYEDARTLIRAGLYQAGSDHLLDEAVRKYEKIDGFIAMKDNGNAMQSLETLSEILQDEGDLSVGEK